MDTNEALRKEVERVEELLARLRGAKPRAETTGPKPIREVITKVIYDLAEQDKVEHDAQND